MTELLEIYASLKVGLPNISKADFINFNILFDLSKLDKSLYGATYYKYFCLDRVSDQSLVSKIYPHDKEQADKLISKIFNIQVN